jgi:hypothetical protein
VLKSQGLNEQQERRRRAPTQVTHFFRVLVHHSLLSQDGETYTLTTTATDANGRQVNNIAVYDKQ